MTRSRTRYLFSPLSLVQNLAGPRAPEFAESDMRLRSLLFVPGDSERKFARARDCGADALILDLEDSVAPLKRPPPAPMSPV